MKQTRNRIIQSLHRIAKAGEESFTGPVNGTSEGFSVQDDEGLELIDILSECGPEPIDLPEGLVPKGVQVCLLVAAEGIGEVGAFIEGTCVGVYAGSCLYVDPEHRGKGIGPALCIGAAVCRGGTVVADWGIHGYCEAGLSAHERAFRAIHDWMKMERGRYAPVLSATEAQPRTKTLGKGSTSSEEHFDIMAANCQNVKQRESDETPAP